MKIKALSIILVTTSAAICSFSQRISYRFSAPNAAHHEAEITVIAEQLPAGAAVFQMSRSSPGRYAKHEFGKNVYNVRAVDATGKSLEVVKDDADVYRVPTHSGTVKLTYTLYGNYADGTYTKIDRTGYHLNMPATFMWVKNLDKTPIYLSFDIPEKSWTIATQLKPANDNYSFTAPDLQFFMDSPIKVGELKMREWSVNNTDQKPIKFRIAFDADASEKLIDTFTQKVEKVVRVAKDIFGEYPAYDFGTYTFLASINPYVSGDGMEHRNSTMITIPAAFNNSNRRLGVFAHEFFHCWNVERIRPKSLEPFDFSKSNMSEALWLAEGFTQYYGQLITERAGLTNTEGFLNGMSRLINEKVNTPGAQLYSPIENSQRAVFVDAGVSVDATNYNNMFTSYYDYGGAIALALDLELRSQFNKSLDDFMIQLWQRHGKPEKPYTLSDVQSVLAEVTGNSSYAQAFFKKYIYGHDSFDYNKLLSSAGFALELQAKQTAWLGNTSFDSTNNGLRVAENTTLNTPLYQAGIDVGDIITEFDGIAVTSPGEIATVLDRHKPGETVSLTYRHMNKDFKTTVTLANNPWLKIVPMNKANEKQLQTAKSWLEGK